MGLGALLARLTAILIVIAILAGCAGYLLPRERTIDSKAVILAPPERVFDFITDVKAQANWRNDEPVIDFAEGSQPPSWSEKASGWELKYHEVKREYPKRYEIAFESPSGFQGRRIYVFEPTESGDRTKLTRTDVLEIGNPLKRVYSYLMIDLESVINAQLEDMGHEFLSEPLDGKPSGSPTDSAPISPAPSPSGSPSSSPTTATPPAATPPTGTPSGTVSPNTVSPNTVSPGAAAPVPTGTGPAASGTPLRAAPSASPSPTPARI
jgi:uncharacterized protein YndB with AHSA1/START domain